MRAKNIMLVGALVLGCVLIFGCVTTETKKPQQQKYETQANSTVKTASTTVETKNTETETVAAKTENRKPDKNSRESVAVMNFKIAVDSGNPDVYLLALKEAFFPELDSAIKVKSIERQQFDKLLSELALSKSDLADEALALKIGKQIGVRYMIFGTATKALNQIKYTCRVVNTETGEVICSLQERGNADAFYDVAETLAQKTVALLESRI